MKMRIKQAMMKKISENIMKLQQPCDALLAKDTTQ